jgi:low affinity Fe/Cu permease
MGISMRKDNNGIKSNGKNTNKFFDNFSTKVTKVTGSSYAFITAALIIVTWALTGPIFHFSDTWQLVVNTGTSVITFLMVFIIQQSQNKDTMALQLKLNELIAASSKASNRLIDVEDLTDDELRQLKKFYCDLGELAGKDNNLFASHSVEEAKEIQEQENREMETSRNALTN